MTLHEPTETIPANRYVYLFTKRVNRLFPVITIQKFNDPVVPAELSFLDDIVFAWTFARDLCNESGILHDSSRRVRTVKERHCKFW